MKFLKNTVSKTLILGLLAQLSSCGKVSELEKPGFLKKRIEATVDKTIQEELLKQMSLPMLGKAEADSQSLADDLASLKADFDKIYKEVDQAKLQSNTYLGLGGKPDNVKFEDIDHWQSINKHYAAGYDNEERLLALFDLTYQNTNSIPHIVRSLLGSVGFADLNLATIIRLIRKAIEEHRRNPTPNLTTGEDAKINEILAKNYEKINSILDRLEKEHGKSGPNIATKWWTRVKWKSQNIGAIGIEPTSFKLADIDFAALLPKDRHKVFNKKMQEIKDVFAQKFGMTTPINLLESFEFVKHGEGQYQVYLAHDTVSSLGMHPHQPMKIIDFINYESTFGHALLKMLFETALKQLVGLIPEPTVATFLKYAVGRWFDLYDQQQTFHRFRILEYINMAQNGNELSPLNFLTEKERKKAAIYILTSEASILDFIFDKPDENKWLQSISEEQNNVVTNKEWTSQHNYLLSPLGPLYFLGQNRGNALDRRMFILGGQRSLSKFPFTAVNYEMPHLERVRRNLLKTIEALLDVVNIPVPMVGLIIEQLYDFLVMKNVAKAEEWEARLVSYLHLIQDQAQELSYNSELNLIYKQRINPFELDLEEEDEHVRKARDFLDLPALN